MVSLTSQAKQKIQELLSKAVESKATPGLVFGATSVEKELCFANAGPRVFGEPSSDPITEDSIFWICSQTKLIVSIAVLQLVERGKLQLDEPASRILPELANPIIVEGWFYDKDTPTRPAQGEITIRKLLNHSSGLTYLREQRDPSYHMSLAYSSKHNKDNPVGYFYSLVREIYDSIPLKFEPGTSFDYGWSSDSLGFIVERVTGQTLEEYFKEHIFLPLGMTSATFYLTDKVQKTAVPLSFRDKDGKLQPWADQIPLIEQDPEKVRLHLAGIGLYSSLKDYLTLLRHLLQIQANTAEHPILQRSSVDSFFLPTLSKDGEKALGAMVRGQDLQWSTALCLNTYDWPGRRRKGSGCWYGWAGTYFMVDPDTGVALVFGSQVLPSQDPDVVRLWSELEEVFYAGLTK